MAMDVINKLYSSVSSTVSQLSGVLPGNPLSREYEILELVTYAGVGMCWKVYNGYKKSTKQEVAIFVFDKKLLEKCTKEDRELILNNLKTGIQQLTKIKHPNILTVQHPLEESRDSLAFATEPIFICLADLLRKHNGSKLEVELSDIEIKYGLLQLCDGLRFIHTDMRIVHRNMNPTSIIINKIGKWKIFGFDFCVIGTPRPADVNGMNGEYEWKYHEYERNRHILTQPLLEFVPPEFLLNSNISTESDLYALGNIVNCIYTKGKPFKELSGKWTLYQTFINDLNRGKYPNLINIPIELRNSVKALIHPSPKHRLPLYDFSNIPFFDDKSVKTLLYMDSSYQWDNLTKSKFFKELTNTICDYPHRVNLFTITPNLIKEFVNPQMIPFVLPNIFIIAKNCDQIEFKKYIFPFLIPVMKLSDPIQILYIIMQNMDYLLKNTPTEDIKEHILPTLYRALECNNSKVQEMCLSFLPNIAKLIDMNLMKKAMLPRIQKLCLTSDVISVKVNCLICIGMLLENFDRWLIMDVVIPFIITIDSRDPAVIMAILGIIKICFTNSKHGLTKQVMATKLIPFLMPLCIENGLTVNQLNQIISLIKQMINQVEIEQRTKLEQINGSSVPKTVSMPDSFSSEKQEYLRENKLIPVLSPFEITPPKSVPLITNTISMDNFNLIEKTPMNHKSIPVETSKSTASNNFNNSISNYSNLFDSSPKNMVTTSNNQQLQNNRLKPIELYKTSNLLEPQKKPIEETNGNTINILSQQDILDFLK